jgi:hypothetical protein
MADENGYKTLAPMVHYGVNRKYGPHIGIGGAGAKVHLYPQFIHIGGADDAERVPLTPRQVRLVSKIIEQMGRLPAQTGDSNAT